MNQSIIFSEDSIWNNELRQIEFTAQNMGNLIVCVIPIATLEGISGRQINDETLALDLFSQYRFDLEEQAEEQIEEEMFNEVGQIVLD
ncbi:DUF1488 family protein [Vibrio sp. RC27]